MVTVVDALGKVEIPREFQEKLGLTPGTPVRIEATAAGLSLTPDTIKAEASVEVAAHGNVADESASHLVEVNGMLVFTGKIDPNFDLEAFSKQMRDERDRKVMGI